MDNRIKGILMAATGAVFWGSSGIAGQYLLDIIGFSPEWLSSFRMMSAGIIMLLLDIFQNRKNIFEILKDKKEFATLILFGIFGVLGAQYTYFVTIKNSNAALATVLQYMMPIMLVFWICLREKRLPTKIEVLCAIFATLGTFFIVTHGRYDTLEISFTALVWGLISAACAAVYTLSPQKLIKKYRTTLVVGWGMIVGGLTLFPLALFTPFTGEINTNSLGAFFYVVLFGTVIAFGLFLASTKYIAPQEAGIIGSLEPLSSVLFSIVVFSMTFGMYELLGMALIISAVIFVTKSKKA